MGDGGRALLFAVAIGLAEDFGGAAVQASATGCGQRLVEMVDEQGVPEVVGDARARALFRQHARSQRLLQQVEHEIFVGARRAGLHLVDDVEFEGAFQHGGPAQQAMTGRAEPIQAQVEDGGNGFRQGFVDIGAGTRG